MNVLVVEVGGTHVKVLATGQKDRREFSSGAKLSAAKMVAKVKHAGGFRLWRTSEATS